MSSSFNSNYFDKIDTKEKAYWLGFLYADGYVKKTNIVLCLSENDIDQLKAFCRVFNINEENIKYRNRKCQNKYYKSADVSLNDKTLVSGLKQNGCIENKSLRIRLPELNNHELYMSFLLGYYDGDGVCGTSVICSGSKEFLNDIKLHFNLQYDVKLKMNPYGQCYVLSVGRNLMRSCFATFDYGIKRKRFFKDDGQIKHWSVKSKHRNRTKIACPCSQSELQLSIVNNSVNNVAKSFDVSYNTINRWIKEMRIIVPSAKQKSISKRKLLIDKSELELLISKTSYVKIGKMFGVSDNCVRKRAKLMGILR